MWTRWKRAAKSFPLTGARRKMPEKRKLHAVECGSRVQLSMQHALPNTQVCVLHKCHTNTHIYRHSQSLPRRASSLETQWNRQHVRSCSLTTPLHLPNSSNQYPKSHPLCLKGPKHNIRVKNQRENETW